MKNKWFDDVFLSSLFERFGTSSHWLTQKQTAICTQYMEEHTERIDTKNGIYNHSNYTYEWRGRKVFLSFSKLNGASTINFSPTAEEIEEIRKKNKERENERQIERIKRAWEKHPEKIQQKTENLLKKIAECKEELQEEEDPEEIEEIKWYIADYEQELQLYQNLKP